MAGVNIVSFVIRGEGNPKAVERVIEEIAIPERLAREIQTRAGIQTALTLTIRSKRIVIPAVPAPPLRRAQRRVKET